GRMRPTLVPLSGAGERPSFRTGEKAGVQERTCDNRHSSPEASMYRIPIYQVKLVRDGSQASERKKVDCAATAARLLQQYLDGADREHFVVLLLDTQNQVIGIHTVTVGTLDASLVHPREVFKTAILANAASVLLAHNHPSGDPT